MILRILGALLAISTLSAEDKSRFELLKAESLAVYERCLQVADQFYVLGEDEDCKEITQAILDSPLTNEAIKQRILATNRRFFLFQYPSDGYQVKGHISFVPDATTKPLLLFLRGGNRIFGLMHPATDYSCFKDYTVLSPAFRGGVSEGEDQFGGEEVNDVQNLMDYLPTLARKLQLELSPKSVYALGGSRGGMEMFLALARSPSLQNIISKAVSLSGLLDIRECMRYRPDMRQMFIRDFGLIPDQNEEEWIAMRNPILAAAQIRHDLPILILQGTNDLRTGIQEGYHMVETLKSHGHPVEYIEIPDGTHCLTNYPSRMDMIADWLER